MGMNLYNQHQQETENPTYFAFWTQGNQFSVDLVGTEPGYQNGVR